MLLVFSYFLWVIIKNTQNFQNYSAKVMVCGRLTQSNLISTHQPIYNKVFKWNNI